LELSDEEITPYAGLGMYGELYKAIGLDREINMIFPEPKSAAGFTANTYIQPLTLMFIGGGKYKEDIRKIKVDKGLRRICEIKTVPSGDAIGDWLRRDSKKKIDSMKVVNDNLTNRILRKLPGKEFTLQDIKRS
ncbi:MAG: IS1380 family transposase, partial [Elusimicrobiota bacterium]|nr:IS1380 family transposase [Elusimicrobiota bacterium]